MFHLFSSTLQDAPRPEAFTYPFCYTPHPLCIQAAAEVQAYLNSREDWTEELAKGKMFGVLVAEDAQGRLGYFSAFSGILAGSNRHPFFVPPVYDLLQPHGFFKTEEQQISLLNTEIQAIASSPAYLQDCRELASTESEAQQTLLQAKQAMKTAKEERDRMRPLCTEQQLETLIRESQHQKASYKRLERHWQEKIAQCRQKVELHLNDITRLKEERKRRSAALQQQLFEQFVMLNARHERKNLCSIFQEQLHKLPPAGAGECAAPKLLQYAFLQGYHPLAMAEFWWGASPKTELREHGHYYPACKGKCEPILKHMLQGLNVEPNPMIQKQQRAAENPLETVYEDDWLLAVNKPAGLLSVPGKGNDPSVYQWMKEHYPEATGPLIVHRLDMDTSGILLLAKTKEVHQALQADFHHRRIQKRYVALLNGIVTADQGSISLPLCADINDRPRQMVNDTHGKPALTRYQVLQRNEGKTRIAFYPETGRTHQLRVHAAHIRGLHCPILGDPLYGTPAERMYLHAEQLEFIHPITQQPVCLSVPAPF